MLLPILQVVNTVLGTLIRMFYDADGNMTAIGQTILTITGLFLAMASITSVFGLISRAIKGLMFSLKAATGLSKGLKLALAGLGTLGVLGLLISFVSGITGGGGGSSDSGGGGISSISAMEMPNLNNIAPRSKDYSFNSNNQSVVLNNQIISQSILDGKTIAKNITKKQRSFSLATSQNIGEH